MKPLHLTVTPSRTLDRTPTDLDLLVTVTAPTRSAVRRAAHPPLNVALVLDRSGSMAGPALTLAKHAAAQFVRRLRPQDRVSLVVFDSEVEVVVPSTEVAHIETVVAAIQGIEARGLTALFAGWQAGMEQVLTFAQPGTLNRVILLTDGEANVGLRDPEGLASAVAAARTRGVSTSALGLGQHYNEVVLESLALSGDGNYAYVASPHDLEAVFDIELRGLQSLVAHTLGLEVQPQPGVEVVEVWHDLPRTAAGQYRLPGLRAGHPVNVALRVRLQPGWHHLDLRLVWTAACDGQSHVQQLTVTLPGPDTVAFAAVPVEKQVAELVAALQIARAKERAVTATLSGDGHSAGLAWQEVGRGIASGCESGLGLWREQLELQELQDQLDRGDVAGVSKLARSQNYARRQSKERSGE